MRKTPLLLAIASVAAISFALRHYVVVDDREELYPGASTEETSAVDAATEEDALVDPARRHEALLASAIDSLSASSSKDAQGESSRVEDWPRSYQRTSFALAGYFLSSAGKANADLLVRHEVLNRDDTPIPENAIDLLRALVSKFNDSVGPLLTNHRHMRSREMVSRIEARLVEPDALPPLTEAERRTLAGIRASQFGTSMDEELARIEPDAPSMFIPYNHIRHQGRVYAQSKFTVLPSSDAAFADIHAVTAEYCLLVLEWFDARGYLKPGAFDMVLGDFGNTTPLKARSASVRRRR